MIRKFRNRKIGKENQKELEVMLTAICIDEDAEIGESIIRNLERGKTEDVAVEVASFMAHKTAERFADMVSGRRFSDIMQMVAGIQKTDPVDAVRMLQWQKENSIPVKAAEKMSPEELKGKIITGIFNDEQYPEYTDEYEKIIEKAGDR